MKINKIAPLVFLAIAVASCSSPKESTDVWVNKEKIKDKSFTNVFIVVLTADVSARLQLETDLYTIATSRGYKAVKSIDVLPVSLDNPKVPTREEVVEKVKASGCDAVFVASLLKKEEEAGYTPGTTAYSISPYYSFNGSYIGYYDHWYPTVSTSDYYSHDKKYYMQSNLYDAATAEVMWSVKSHVFNPESIKKFSTAYTSGLLEQLEKEKILKK